jgi:FAD/FMN-containing dehydrogenase
LGVHSTPPADLRDALAGIVGDAHVVVDPEVRAGYEVDWTRRWHATSAAVVRPADTAAVAAVAGWCRQHGVAIVPQGGNTGLVAGSVPPTGAVLLSLQRLDGLGPLDAAAGQVTAGAGVTLAALQRHVAGSGWEFGVDLAARDSCTIGGMVATNAGGIRVMRHGAMRAQVLGVEAVLADGSVVRHLGGLVKDNTGYDLAGLLCGSEGTLGIVTAARLRLVPQCPDRVVALVALASLDDAVALAGALRVSVPGLDALEAVVASGLSMVCEHLGHPMPFAAEPAVTLLAEWAGHGEPPAAFADLVSAYPTLAADDPAGRARLWAYREGQTEAIARLGVPHKLDVTLPLSTLAQFGRTVPGVVAAVHPTARTHLFGHLGDGNLHVNITGVPPDDDAVDEAVLRLVVDLGGSLSAEHGIGRAKVRWLPLQRSAAELAAMRAIKQALDPTGILNPGALLG